MVKVIEATTRPLVWVCRDGGNTVVASGTTGKGDVTATGLHLLSDADENALLGALLDAGVSALPLPDVGTEMRRGDIYDYNDTLLMVRHDTVRVAGDPLAQVSEFGVYREGAEAFEWVAGELLEVGARRLDDGVLYELWRDIGDANWSAPHLVPAHWRVVETTAPDEWPQWVQPYGGSGTYVSGAQVTYNGQHWINVVPAPTLNVWAPGVYGWELAE